MYKNTVVQQKDSVTTWIVAWGSIYWSDKDIIREKDPCLNRLVWQHLQMAERVYRASEEPAWGVCWITGLTLSDLGQSL